MGPDGGNIWGPIENQGSFPKYRLRPRFCQQTHRTHFLRTITTRNERLGISGATNDSWTGFTG